MDAAVKMEQGPWHVRSRCKHPGPRVLAGGVFVKWDVEDVPDGDVLYRRVHVNLLPADDSDGAIPPGTFKGGQLSSSDDSSDDSSAANTPASSFPVASACPDKASSNSGSSVCSSIRNIVSCTCIKALAKSHKPGSSFARRRDK